MDGKAPGDSNAVALGLSLRRLRTERSLTQAEVASRAGLARAHYGALESGSSSNGAPANPRLNTILHLAHALGVSVEEVVAGLRPFPPGAPPKTEPVDLSP